MTTWTEANGVSMLAAAQAHGDYGIDTAAWPVSVYDAIYRAGVVLMWQHMPRQFGAYVNDPGSRPGILVNNGLPHAAQRQTAGHELGHHWWEHGTRQDGDLDPPGDRRPSWPPEEKLAESFAAWFLMPRKAAAAAALKRLGVTQLRSPAEAYQLSLLLGTPYRATVRHLPNIRLISAPKSAEWIKVPPNVIKDRLDHAQDTLASRKPDVWVLGPRFDGAQLTVHPGDRIVITSPSDSRPSVSCTGKFTELPVRLASHAIEIQAGEEPSERCGVQVTDASGHWEVAVQVEGQRSGIDPRWVG
jgi:Zn-dependent peptidase ImmA (M78 family)